MENSILFKNNDWWIRLLTFSMFGPLLVMLNTDGGLTLIFWLSTLLTCYILSQYINLFNVGTLKNYLMIKDNGYEYGNWIMNAIGLLLFTGVFFILTFYVFTSEYNLKNLGIIVFFITFYTAIYERGYMVTNRYFVYKAALYRLDTIASVEAEGDKQIKMKLKDADDKVLKFPSKVRDAVLEILEMKLLGRHDDFQTDGARGQFSSVILQAGRMGFFVFKILCIIILFCLLAYIGSEYFVTSADPEGESFWTYMFIHFFAFLFVYLQLSHKSSWLLLSTVKIQVKSRAIGFFKLAIMILGAYFLMLYSTDVQFDVTYFFMADCCFLFFGLVSFVETALLKFSQKRNGYDDTDLA